MEANLPENEEARLAALASYQILDTLPEQSYDDITRLASSLCGAPMALISLIDRDRQWFKSRVGLDVTQTPRSVAFCAHAILQPEQMLIVPDARQDPRFADNPAVQGEPHIRFYAGAPLVTSGGHAVGTLCVVAQAPRDLTPQQKQDLQALARQVMVQLELRQSQLELEKRVDARTAELRTRARQQEAVAELGQRALSNIDMDILLQGATALVAATLNVEISSVLERMPGGKTLHIRAGTGGRGSSTGVIIDAERHSQSGYALQSKTPVIVTDLRTETRFTPSPFLLKSGIISSLVVIVEGYEKPFGTLSAHSVRSRSFTQNDVNFLQAMANVIAAALERHRVETEIRQLNTQLRHSNEQLRIENIERQVTMSTLNLAVKAHQEAKDEAESANRAKSEFLSRMSHELRTPLNAILGFGQILDRQELTPLQHESVGYVLKGGRHLLELVNEVLDISRVEAGGAKLSIEPVALDEVVPEACALVHPLAADRGIRLHQELQTQGRVHVMADRQRLKQVLINLLSNAIKYNRPDGEVTVSCQQRPNGQICIAVRDTGLGIAAADLSKLFTPFERLGAANSEVEGTGLGLVLSQRLVQAMGGTLKVESVVGQGSAFFIELACAEAPENTLEISTLGYLETGEREATHKQYSVLCIEDNPSNLRLFEILLASRPEVTLISATQGAAGLNLARQQEPDLILLDVHLPDMSGLEVLAQLRRSAITRDIPVLVISADATPTQIEQVEKVGVLAYLTKPLDVKAFLEILDELLRKNE